MKIYTRTGDKGSTSLFSGGRVSKNHPLIKALGAVDEGNSALGVAFSFIPQEEKFKNVRSQITVIQHALFDVGAAIATPRTSEEKQKLEKTLFGHESIDLLEKWIDSMEEQLPPLKTFILPGGHPGGAALHLCRSIMRRAERHVIPLYEKGEVCHDVLIYLNRLSDYLFVAARFTNHLVGVPEILWK